MDDMSDLEFARALNEMYEELVNSTQDSDWEVDQTQGQKYFAILHLFTKLKNETGGKIEMGLTPRRMHGYIDGYFSLVDLTEEMIEQFCDRLKAASAINIQAMRDGTVNISVTVPDVFVLKKQK